MEKKFGHVKVGDVLIRNLAGANLPVRVTKVCNNVITVEPDEPAELVEEKVRRVERMMGMEPEEFHMPNWTFSAVTGGEIDLELGYDGIYTCSFLKEK